MSEDEKDPAPLWLKYMKMEPLVPPSVGKVWEDPRGNQLTQNTRLSEQGKEPRRLKIFDALVGSLLLWDETGGFYFLVAPRTGREVARSLPRYSLNINVIRDYLRDENKSKVPNRTAEKWVTENRSQEP